MQFNDPYNPSYEEIETWAYSYNVYEPVQDWDIIVNWLIYSDLILTLASDNKCPQQEYFQHILYVVVGQAVRGRLSSRNTMEIETLLEHSEKFYHPFIKQWKQRSKDILKHTEEFDYDDWFSGRLAKSTIS
ncbi:hypothetical protein JCM14469_43390 [Desulfatiferula olefinivorans]